MPYDISCCFPSCEDTKYLCYGVTIMFYKEFLICHLSPASMLTCFPAKRGTVTSMLHAATSMKSYQHTAPKCQEML